MLGSLSIGTAANGATVRRGALETRTSLSPGTLTIRMARIRAGSVDTVSLETLEVDGQSVLDQVPDAVSPQLAANPDPGRVSGQGRIVSALTGPLEVGALYLVSYEVLADHGTAALYFSDSGGCPFPNTVAAPFTIGRHKILVEAKDTDSAALMRLSGDLTFANVSCRKAEWTYTLPEGGAHGELAATPEPGRVTGEAVEVSALTAPLEPGVPHTLRYEILAAGPEAELYMPLGTAPDTERAFLPTTPGHHSVTLTAALAGVADAVRMSGDLTFGHVSCRRAGGVAGRQILARVRAGSAQSGGILYTPDPGALYVAPWGDDAAGTGAYRSPFATPARALEMAGPGDTVFLRPGLYPPFQVPVSGVPDRPITLTTLPGEERQAIVEGDLMRHARYGGPGIAPDQRTRDGIYVPARDHIHIRNLTVRNVWRAGIFVVGRVGETHGHHVIAGNAVSMTGSSGIYVGGNNSSQIIPLGETGALRIHDVLIEGNDVSQTNVVTDYNDNTTNPQGVPGGVAEAITVAASSSAVVTRFNDVHDTRQYGIDYKAGVRGGAIYGNRVWNVERYGIYLDSGRRFVEDVAIYGNRVWDCRVGIVLSREAGSNTVEYSAFRAAEGAAEFVQTLARIDIFNNLVWNTEEAGIFCQRHPQKDGPDGAIRNLRIRFNTVYNANARGDARDLNLSGWSDGDFVAAGVCDGVEFLGNLVWNDRAPVAVRNTFGGVAGFTVAGNLIGTDPGFTDPSGTPPDLSLAAGSAAAGLVEAAAMAPPFGLDIGGADRVPGAAAGAYAAG